MQQRRSDVLMKGCTFPSVSLMPGSSCSPNSTEASSGWQHPLCATRRAVSQKAASAGFGLVPVCGRQLFGRPQGAQEGSPRHS